MKKSTKRPVKTKSFLRTLVVRTFLGLGILAFVLLVLVALCLGYVFYVDRSLTPSADVYANESIRAIISSWSEDELVKRSSSELREATTKRQLDDAFLNFKNMGTLQHYSPARGKITVHFYSEKGIIIKATCVAGASFQNGKADIRVELIRSKDGWELSGFHLEPATLHDQWEK